MGDNNHKAQVIIQNENELRLDNKFNKQAKQLFIFDTTKVQF